jgi:hypothetical protein
MLGGWVVLSALVCVAAGDQIENIINQTSVGEYQSYLKVLAGVDPIPGSPPAYLPNRFALGPYAPLAGQYIRNELSGFGLNTAVQSFAIEGNAYGQNIIGELPGTTRPNDIYVICAHYDSIADDPWLAHGADDNASGTAAVLTAARVLSQYQFEGTLRFIAFSAEEQGLIGSEAYASAAHAAGDNIIAAINLDMILHPGFDGVDPDPDYDLDLDTNNSSYWLGQYLAAKFGAYTPLAVQVHNDGSYGSDQYSFWQVGYDALEVAENTADEVWGGSNFEYHMRTDVFDNPHLDWDFGLNAVRGSMAGLIGLAGLVPEPSAALLLGVLALLTTRRRARASFSKAKPQRQIRTGLGCSGRGLACVPFVLALVANCFADVIYVDDDAPPGGNGSSWPTAFRCVQDALAAALPGAEIRVAQGTYRPDQSETGVVTPGDRQASFQLPAGVAVYGGYRGCPGGDCNAADPNDRDVDLYATILSGDLLGNDGADFANDAENAYHVVTIVGEGNTAVLDGFSITGGNADASGVDTRGGGVYCGPGSAATISACQIERNVAAGGGGLCCDGSQSVVAHCGILVNHGGSGGGVFCLADSSPLLTDCSIALNVAEEGAGLFCADSQPTLDHCAISGNRAGYAAGLLLLGGQPTLADCAITTNVAQTEGGGLYALDSAPLLTDCAISWNTAGQSGAGVNCSGTLLGLVRCTLQGNWACYADSPYSIAYGDGGGLYCSFATISAQECNFSGNAAEQGGAILSSYGTVLNLTDCTVSGNMAVDWGGGLLCWGGPDSALTCTRGRFTGNHTGEEGWGGAISFLGYSGSATIADSVFSGNQAWYGGALDYEGDADLTVVNSIFAGNRALWSGGAINAFLWGSNQAVLTNCTFGGNAASAGAAVAAYGTTPITNSVLWGGVPDEISDDGGVSVTFSDVHGGWSGLTNLEVDPLWVGGPAGSWTDAGEYDYWTGLVTFTDASAAWTADEWVGKLVNPQTSLPFQLAIVANTATTITVRADWPTINTGVSGVPANAGYQVYDYHHTSASPCINAGTDDAPALPPADAEGQPRTQQCRPDLGPFESVDPPAVFVDCNTNGVLDDCDVYNGTSVDCSHNYVPDECEPDCNGNGAADSCDILAGTSQDCTGNGVPDECEPDCNGNGVADSCDLAAGTSADCNGNDVPDECDIADGTSADCTGNGLPDECEPDCNGNGVADSCDILGGTSGDCDDNGVPDECELELAVVFPLDSDPGWSCDGQWAFGQPTGLGSYNHDPTSGHTGNYVYGYNLNGDYANGMPAYYLTTNAIHCNGASGVLLSFWRWLGVEHSYFDHATVAVSNNGSTWYNVWTNAGSVVDYGWTLQVFNISWAADGEATVYIRWGMGPTDSTVTYPGWNIDDVEITGTRDCNGNGVLDQCDIANGTSPDANGNGVPDECEALNARCPGDLNCDGSVDFADINAFVSFLTDYDGWRATFRGCDARNGDLNCDGTYGQGSLDDINAFVMLMQQCGGQGCPCPGPLPCP